ncbi:MAG: alkaline phosphatase family protein [Deltaproteobacteria bacterium]|nr:alkaline phosphatase family protein [Deltaproteobacteria bacterium]
MRSLVPFGLLTVASLLACTDAPPAGDASADAAPADAALDSSAPPEDRPRVRPPEIPRTEPDTARAMQRQRCTFGPGAWPAETLGQEVPVGDQMPLQHILVLMQENRSFDHYFSRLPRAGRDDVDVPPEGWTNPRADGSPVPLTHDTERCIEDVHHGWDATHRQYNNGRMDGFVTTNDPLGERAMTYFDETDLPFYYSLANTFSIGDRYFCSLLGPTFPNRFYLMAGTSFGLVVNNLAGNDTRQRPAQHLYSRLDDAGIDWREYSGGARMVGFFPYYGLLRAETRAHMATIDQLREDLRTGRLPPFAFIEPDYFGSGGNRVDEHPPGIPMNGERFVEGIVRALMASPAWATTALFILYDEHGGFADHAPPPEACEPDALTPHDGNGRAFTGRFDRLGFRVPFFVVSPYARRHYVSHRVFDHTSVLRFVEARFGLPALTRRDANANIPTDMFDFQNPPFMTPPTLTPSNGVDMATRDRCNARFPGAGGL